MQSVTVICAKAFFTAGGQLCVCLCIHLRVHRGTESEDDSFDIHAFMHFHVIAGSSVINMMNPREACDDATPALICSPLL